MTWWSQTDLLITWWILIALRFFWYHLKGLLKGFLWPFRLLKSVKYPWSYGLNEVCDKFDQVWKDAKVPLLAWSCEDFRAQPRWLFRKNLMGFFIGLQSYLYYNYSGCTLQSHNHMSFPECSMIIWPCHVIWLAKSLHYLYPYSVVCFEVLCYDMAKTAKLLFIFFFFFFFFSF